ncbi:hypothetical protein [Victivallis vadensis]|uniref:MerR-like DNA binding protein n=1 Tax=Victivallis vadensis TaxID=172901 RepID=A0A2U1ARG9_9BACT|nr:hypothetical protein [Victivallis vadensis]NMD87374.1 hypothetical protein [Victivallis vadensis]PVY39005.1 hypothetical protein C8D82_12358 [Victivallis vadensis]HJH04696.1 hypothetical protein [Victivallis vadensis]
MNEVQPTDLPLLRNLEDAGCDAETVEKYFQLRQAGKIRDQQRLLSKQRRLLLEALHANQRKIDNLDYLLYTLKTTPRSS